MGLMLLLELADSDDNLGKEAAGEFDQAHHLIPIELIKESEFVRKAIEAGFEFNGKINGKWVKQFSSKIDDLKDGIHASHPEYTKRVLKLINKNIEDYAGLANKNIDDLTGKELKSIMENTAKQLDSYIDNLKDLNKVSTNKHKTLNEFDFLQD